MGSSSRLSLCLDELVVESHGCVNDWESYDTGMNKCFDEPLVSNMLDYQTCKPGEVENSFGDSQPGDYAQIRSKGGASFSENSEFFSGF